VSVQGCTSLYSVDSIDTLFRTADSACQVFVCVSSVVSIVPFVDTFMEYCVCHSAYRGIS